jgi:hypothetical protein
VHLAAHEVREKALEVAGDLLEQPKPISCSRMSSFASSAPTGRSRSPISTA